MGLTFAEKLAQIPEYEAGMPVREARERHAIEDVVKLASNESPFPPVAGVIEAVRGAVPEINRYPDPSAHGLRQAIADHFELAIDRVAVGNGSCEILLAAAEALCDPGSDILYAWPSFSMYPHLPAITASRAIEVPLADDQKHDLGRMAVEVTAATRLAIVDNPNNPTGTCVASAEIAEFLERVPNDLCVIVDQAYVEFQTVEDPDESLALLDRFPNVVLLRTFSKVYGLSGLRVGYALGSDQFRRAVDQVRQPFSVNHLAQVAASEALKHGDDVLKRVEQNAVERLWVEEKLAELGLTTADTEANFSWIALDDLDERQVVDGLGKRGVIVRPGAALGAPGHIRVTYGTRTENQRFIEALREVVAGPRHPEERSDEGSGDGS